jgi:hypothetical protein
MRGDQTPGWSQHFDLCGVGIALECGDRVNGEAVRALLVRFFCIQETQQGAPALRFVLDESIAPATSVKDDLFSSRQLRVSRTASGYLLRSGASYLNLDLGAATATGRIAPGFLKLSGQFQRAFFFLPFLLLLPRCGLFGLHANGLLVGDAGFMVAGASGSGKTTLSLALMRLGWQYVSDDMLMLRHGREGVEALAFRRGFACCPDTITTFPELVSGHGQSRLPSVDKILVDAEACFPTRQVRVSRPQAVFFSELREEASSTLIPVDPTEALAGLIRNSPGVLTLRNTVEDQMELLRQLVGGVQSYRLLLGRDVLREPEAVAEMIANAGGTSWHKTVSAAHSGGA